MHKPLHWHPICALDDIVPDTGVCALVNDRPVAVFHLRPLGADDAPRVCAIDNVDPNSKASVLSRGIVGNLGERTVVASPIYKHHFDLDNGECLEVPEHSVQSYPVRLHDDFIWVGA